MVKYIWVILPPGNGNAWTQMGTGPALLKLDLGKTHKRAAIVHVKHVLVVSANGTKIFVVKPGDQEQVAFPE